MANFSFPDRFYYRRVPIDDPPPPSLQCTELGSRQSLSSLAAVHGARVWCHCWAIDLNVDPDRGSPPRCVELGFGTSAGIIDLNVDPDCGSGVGDPCPSSLQCTELGFAAGAGIIDLNVDPDCGSPPRCVERFDLNAEASDSDFSDFFVGRRSPASNLIELFSRARSGNLEGGFGGSYSGSEEQILAIGDEHESNEEAPDQMQEDVTLLSCLDCIELLRRDDCEQEEIDNLIDERELEYCERDEAEDDVDLNHEMVVLSLERDWMDAEPCFVDGDREGMLSTSTSHTRCSLSGDMYCQWIISNMSNGGSRGSSNVASEDAESQSSASRVSTAAWSPTACALQRCPLRLLCPDPVQSPLCELNRPDRRCANNQCHYTHGYDSHAVTKGIVATETYFGFATDGRQMEFIRNIVFGCGRDSQNFRLYSQITGFMGLNMMSTSFLTHASNDLRGQFAYCLQNIPRTSKLLAF
uniref:Xylanase inhibitor N-terminal domain-containing protein n=1 Tax=Ananas comosus var. bracteatus TaxID=296719 RepID=A0A6V7P256_ANACO|nr:unnamed protein product [Ananas comosus var. bracteatus]